MYRGCEFACKYCYARYTHEFMEMRNGIEFEQKIYAKQHAVELLRQELRRVKPGEEIALGTATDPYQPIERKLEITRAILQEFARHAGFELGIVTKSALIARDIDMLKEISQHNQLTVDSPKQLEAVVRAAAAAGATHAYANPLFLKPCSAAVFMPFLKESFPQLVADYQQRFKERAFLPAAYRKRISELFVRLRAKYGITGERYSRNERSQPSQQLDLF